LDAASTVVSAMKNPTISGPASQLLEVIRESEVFRSLIEQHTDLRELIIKAARRGGEFRSSSVLFEAVAPSACTSSRFFEARCSGNKGNSAELGELELLASQADEHLGTVLREFCPGAPATIGDEVNAAAPN
jgi:hypothetical protein